MSLGVSMEFTYVRRFTVKLRTRTLSTIIVRTCVNSLALCRHYDCDRLCHRVFTFDSARDMHTYTMLAGLCVSGSTYFRNILQILSNFFSN